MLWVLLATKGAVDSHPVGRELHRREIWPPLVPTSAFALYQSWASFMCTWAPSYGIPRYRCYKNSLRSQDFSRQKAKAIVLPNPDSAGAEPAFCPHPATLRGAGPDLHGSSLEKQPLRLLMACGQEAPAGGNSLRRALGSLCHRCRDRRETRPCALPSHLSQQFKEGNKEFKPVAAHLNPAMSSGPSSNLGNWGWDPGGQYQGTLIEACVWRSIPLPSTGIYNLTIESTDEVSPEDKINT